MSLKKFVKKMDTVTCSKDATAHDIANAMRENETGTILVTHNNEAIGFITDRDMVIRCLAESNPKGTAEDFMTSPVQTISKDASILELTEKMGEKGVRRICVVDEDQKPLGIISMADVFELLAHEMGQLAEALGERHYKLFYRAVS